MNKLFIERMQTGVHKWIIFAAANGIAPTYFKDEHVIVTDTLEIANKLNLYFTNICSNLAKDIHSSTNKDFASYLIKVEENISQFNFQDVDEDTIRKIIDGFQPKKKLWI